MAFGLDIEQYRNFPMAVLSLLRMSVGDFDYDELSDSHYWVGPAFFWFYIVLMFFILMSVFIALISEGYEEARDELRRESDQRESRTQSTGKVGVMVRAQMQVRREKTALGEQLAHCMLLLLCVMI